MAVTMVEAGEDGTAWGAAAAALARATVGLLMLGLLGLGQRAALERATGRVARR